MFAERRLRCAGYVVRSSRVEEIRFLNEETSNDERTGSSEEGPMRSLTKCVRKQLLPCHGPVSVVLSAEITWMIGRLRKSA